MDSDSQGHKTTPDQKTNNQQKVNQTKPLQNCVDKGKKQLDERPKQSKIYKSCKLKDNNSKLNQVTTVVQREQKLTHRVTCHNILNPFFDVEVDKNKENQYRDD